MNDLYRAALDLQAFCQARGWRFCFIGGVAVQRWGEPRQTDDADLTLLTGFGHEEAFVDPLLEKLAPRRPDAREFALMNRVLLARHREFGVPLDIALGAFPFEENAIARATFWDCTGEGDLLLTCSAADLIIYKAFANRGIDWQDIERILQRHGAALDFALVWRELLPLLELKEDPAIEPRLRELIARHASE